MRSIVDADGSKIFHGDGGVTRLTTRSAVSIPAVVGTGFAAGVTGVLTTEYAAKRVDDANPHKQDVVGAITATIEGAIAIGAAYYLQDKYPSVAAGLAGAGGLGLVIGWNRYRLAAPPTLNADANKPGGQPTATTTPTPIVGPDGQTGMPAPGPGMGSQDLQTASTPAQLTAPAPRFRTNISDSLSPNGTTSLTLASAGFTRNAFARR